MAREPEHQLLVPWKLLFPLEALLLAFVVLPVLAATGSDATVCLLASSFSGNLYALIVLVWRVVVHRTEGGLVFDRTPRADPQATRDSFALDYTHKTFKVLSNVYYVLFAVSVSFAVDVLVIFLASNMAILFVGIFKIFLVTCTLDEQRNLLIGPLWVAAWTIMYVAAIVPGLQGFAIVCAGVSGAAAATLMHPPIYIPPRDVTAAAAVVA